MREPNNNGRCPTEKRYCFLRDTATAKGLTLRQETDTGVKPRTFELVYRGTPRGETPIRGGITRQQITRNDDNSVLNLINTHPNL